MDRGRWSDASRMAGHQTTAPRPPIESNETHLQSYNHVRSFLTASRPFDNRYLIASGLLFVRYIPRAPRGIHNNQSVIMMTVADAHTLLTKKRGPFYIVQVQYLFRLPQVKVYTKRIIVDWLRRMINLQDGNLLDRLPRAINRQTNELATSWRDGLIQWLVSCSRD